MKVNPNLITQVRKFQGNDPVTLRRLFLGGLRSWVRLVIFLRRLGIAHQYDG